MTLLFWAILGLMTVIALAFVLWPLLRAGSAANVSRRQTNIAIYRERLAELQQAQEAGTLGAGDAAALQQDIERKLLSDASEPESTPSANAGGASRRWTALTLVLLLPVLAIALYVQTGDWRLSIAGGGLPAADILVERLAEHLKEQPNDAEGWMLLARASAALQKYTVAADAYMHLNALTGPMPENLVSEAEMRALAAGGSLKGAPSELVARALALDPNFGRALWYSGLIAFQGGDKRSASDYWQKLSKQDLPDEFRKILDDRIAQADGKAPGSVHTKADQPATGLHLPVHVTLDPHLAEQVSAETPVFIYAKAAEGPPMPLAVVRKRVGDLPLSINLDDSMAIMGTHKLSDFSRWVVTARIALHGSAEPQPGDFYAERMVTRGNAQETVELTINRTLP